MWSRILKTDVYGFATSLFKTNCLRRNWMMMMMMMMVMMMTMMLLLLLLLLLMTMMMMYTCIAQSLHANVAYSVLSVG